MTILYICSVLEKRIPLLVKLKDAFFNSEITVVVLMSRHREIPEYCPDLT